jgi:hypothetical protein
MKNFVTLNKKTISTNQKVCDTAILLQQLADICIDLLGYELLGTAYKHGMDPINQNFEDHRAAIAIAAIKLLQETNMSRQELLEIWEEEIND